MELLNESLEEKSLCPVGCRVGTEGERQFTLCPVEAHRYRKWMETHTCDKGPTELGFGTMAAHWVCFRYGMIDEEKWVQCECGEKFNLSHWEHA